MALQRLGKADMRRLLEAMQLWSSGSWLEKTRRSGSLAEPVLLHHEEDALRLCKFWSGSRLPWKIRMTQKKEDFKVCNRG